MNPLLVVLFLPLATAVFNRLFGARLGKGAAAGLACASVLVAFAFAADSVLGLAALPAASRQVLVHVYDLLDLASFRVGFDLLLDPLSGMMILVVTGIGFLIHLYAVGYMHEEDAGEYARFFAYVNFFVFSMLTLVLAANFLVIFTGWELVGVSSYLLIGFYRGKTSAADAGKKAFIVNRVGDFGFLMAIFLIWNAFGSLDFSAVLPHAAALSPGMATAVGLLLFMGAAGKSAQGPLHVWLPDAMEGPTPVSALIHAATMVTAGVFLVARCHAIFELSPLALGVVAWTGALTAFLAATVAMVQVDIKRVWAYSTVSQLGYMVLGVGVGAYTAGLFHLLTHAFFKALLFLAAGSVMHALHGELDMRRMGGLWRKMPLTCATMIVGAACLAGVPLTSGFFSKDEILLMALRGPHADFGLWLLGYLGAACTAFYSGRLIFSVFFGKPRDHHAYEHAHESPWVMGLPLVLLAVGSLAVGLLGLPGFLTHWQPFTDWLAPVFADLKAVPEASASRALVLGLMALYTGTVAVLGWIAWRLYTGEAAAHPADGEATSALHRLLWNKYFFDEAYGFVFVRALLGYSRWLWRWVDQGLVDGTVNGVAAAAQAAGDFLRGRVHNGRTRQYAAYLAAGACLLLGLALIYHR